MVCDSNVIIDYLNGDAEVISLLRSWQKERRQLFISPISITEVLGLPRLNKEEFAIAHEFLDEFVIASLGYARAYLAASLCREYKLKTPDSLIAATALTMHIPLVSRDRQFRKIDQLILVLP